MKRIPTNKIIERTAFEMLCENDITSIRTEEIVRNAGISKRTFYVYFKDKYDVCCQIYLHFQDVCWGVDDVRQNLPGFLERSSDILEGNKSNSAFLKNTMLFKGQNCLSEYVVTCGVQNLERLLVWNSRDDLLTTENKFLFEFYMRGMVSMSSSSSSYFKNLSLSRAGAFIYNYFPGELYDALTRMPP